MYLLADYFSGEDTTTLDSLKQSNVLSTALVPLGQVALTSDKITAVVSLCKKPSLYDFAPVLCSGWCIYESVILIYMLPLVWQKFYMSYKQSYIHLNFVHHAYIAL